jgi:hypothetical protein
MRDRLIELLNKQVGMTLPVWMAPQTIEILADGLLANGVIVLPFDIGDTLYDISEFVEKRSCPEMYELNDGYISIRKDKNGEYFFEYDCIDILPNEIGKTVFLTREEAEQALKGGAE